MSTALRLLCVGAYVAVAARSLWLSHRAGVVLDGAVVAVRDLSAYADAAAEPQVALAFRLAACRVSCVGAGHDVAAVRTCMRARCHFVITFERPEDGEDEHESTVF